jgi:hypothetical protein
METSPAISLGPRALEVECKVLKDYESNLAPVDRWEQASFCCLAALGTAAQSPSRADWTAIDRWTARNGCSDVGRYQTTQQQSYSDRTLHGWVFSLKTRAMDSRG